MDDEEISTSADTDMESKSSPDTVDDLTEQDLDLVFQVNMSLFSGSDISVVVRNNFFLYLLVRQIFCTKYCK